VLVNSETAGCVTVVWENLTKLMCAGFRMPAHGDGAACAGAGVRKPPKNEPAGDVRGKRSAQLWGFCRGFGLAEVGLK
jgi:hypothetical protein